MTGQRETSPDRPQGSLFRAVIRTGSAVLRWTLTRYFRVVTAGLERIPPHGPAIVAGNHPSLLDGLLLYLLTPQPLRFMAHHELFRHPLIGPFMRGLGFIDAGGRRRALREAETALRTGEVLVVFPEGDAYACGRMDRLHPGVAVLALRTAAPIIPMAIAGAAEAHPVGTYLPRPRTIAMVFGSPLQYADRPPAFEPRVDDSSLVWLLVDLRQRILDLENTARRLLEAPRPRVPLRVIRVMASGLLLLPLVALLNVTAHGLEGPERDDARERGAGGAS